MSVRTPRVGIDHLTVVPANFDPEQGDVQPDDSDGGREA